MALELRLIYGLPMIDIDIIFAGRRMHLNNVLLDTGCAGTILDADVVTEIGVKPEGTDQTAVIHGIGGSEIVFTKWFDSITLGNISVNQCKVEIGVMDYGIDIQGILGFDFIREAKLIIDTIRMEVYTAS
jgi:hypothetical protein